MAGTLAEDGVQRLLIGRHKVVGHEGLNGSGKAAAVDAGGTAVL